jgi:hypothetical protein
VTAQINASYLEGQRYIQGQAAIRMLELSAELQKVKWEKDSVVRVADGVARRAVSRASTLDQAIKAVPEAVRDSHPAVDRALFEAEALSADVRRLTEVRILEQQAFERVIFISDSTLQEQLKVHAKQATDMQRLVVVNAQLEVELVKRPKWRTVVAWGTAGFGAGLALGKIIF